MQQIWDENENPFCQIKKHLIKGVFFDKPNGKTKNKILIDKIKCGGIMMM